jgi:hypothetical protein
MSIPADGPLGMRAPLRLNPALAFLALAVWLMLTIGIGHVIGDGQKHPLAYAASSQIGWPWLAAAAFAGLVAWRAGADAMGLHRPSPTSSIKLVWLPLIYAGVMLAADLLIGLPSATMTAILAVNMLLVGLSEELMFRSIMFRGLLARFRVWPAILLTSLLFGLVHSLNVFTTGQMDQAVLQSTAAFMQGLAYLAIRIRTRSVWPMVIVHALWDFSLMLPGTTRAAGAGVGWSWTPLLVALPIFLYGLYLLRHVGKNDGSGHDTDVLNDTQTKGST